MALIYPFFFFCLKNSKCHHFRLLISLIYYRFLSIPLFFSLKLYRGNEYFKYFLIKRIFFYSAISYKKISTKKNEQFVSINDFYKLFNWNGFFDNWWNTKKNVLEFLCFFKLIIFFSNLYPRYIQLSHLPLNLNDYLFLIFISFLPLLYLHSNPFSVKRTYIHMYDSNNDIIFFVCLTSVVPISFGWKKKL